MSDEMLYQLNASVSSEKKEFVIVTLKRQDHQEELKKIKFKDFTVQQTYDEEQHAVCIRVRIPADGGRLYGYDIVIPTGQKIYKEKTDVTYYAGKSKPDFSSSIVSVDNRHYVTNDGDAKSDSVEVKIFKETTFDLKSSLMR